MKQKTTSAKNGPEFFLLALLFQAGFILLLPLLAPLFLLGLLLSARLRRFWPQRFGLIRVPEEAAGKTLIHVSSLGELNGLSPLLDLLDRKKEPYCLSVYTDTGLLRARLRHPGVFTFILPFDAGPFLPNLFHRLKPRRVVISETELWPGLLLLCRLRGIPLFLVNGRISEKNLRRLKFVRPFIRLLLRCFSGIFVQDAFSLQAIRLLCPEAAPVLTGNTKTDSVSFNRTRSGRLSRRTARLTNRPVLLGGSLRGREYLILTEAWMKLRTTDPGLQLVLVPRHLKAAEEWTKKFCKKKIPFVCLSRKEAGEIPQGTILIADKMGVLNDFYILSDFVFVGGTIEPLGGHNPIEPALRSNVILHGSSTQNNQPGFDILSNAGVSLVVHNAREIAQALQPYLSSAEQTKRLKKKTREAFRKAPRVSPVLYTRIFRNGS